jgi:hypothetical protein
MQSAADERQKKQKRNSKSGNFTDMELADNHYSNFEIMSSIPMFSASAL